MYSCHQGGTDGQRVGTPSCLLCFAAEWGSEETDPSQPPRSTHLFSCTSCMFSMPMALLRREPNGPDFFRVGLFPGTISDCEESPQLSAHLPWEPWCPPHATLSPAAPGPEAEATSKKEQEKTSVSRESPPTAQRAPPGLPRSHCRLGPRGLAATPLGRERPSPHHGYPPTQGFVGPAA